MSHTATATQLESLQAPPPAAIELNHVRSSSGRPLGAEPKQDGLDMADMPNLPDEVPPADAHSQVERWNYPKKNVGKLGFAFLSFIIAGMNDGAVGVCLLSSPTG